MIANTFIIDVLFITGWLQWCDNDVVNTNFPFTSLQYFLIQLLGIHYALLLFNISLFVSICVAQFYSFSHRSSSRPKSAPLSPNIAALIQKLTDQSQQNTFVEQSQQSIEVNGRLKERLQFYNQPQRSVSLNNIRIQNRNSNQSYVRGVQNKQSRSFVIKSNQLYFNNLLR